MSNVNMNKENVEYVFNTVKEMEKEYNTKDSIHTIKDIEKCYSDWYILATWEGEKEDENSFEEFLIDLIEQNLQLEKYKEELECKIK